MDAGELASEQASAYARLERERRFLVPALPGVTPSAERRITDLYIAGTRLRLRRSVTVGGGGDRTTEVVRKLTQKIPAPRPGVVGVQGWVTNTYLDEDEYARLAVLPGRWLTKRRLSIDVLGVDVFEGALAPLVIAEAEFADDDSMLAFEPPAWCGREITTDPAYTGARLAARAAGQSGTA